MTDTDYRQAAIYIAVKKRNFLTYGELSSIKCLVCRQKKMIHYLYRWYVALSPRAYHLTT